MGWSRKFGVEVDGAQAFGDRVKPDADGSGKRDVAMDAAQDVNLAITDRDEAEFQEGVVYGFLFREESELCRFHMYLCRH